MGCAENYYCEEEKRGLTNSSLVALIGGAFFLLGNCDRGDHCIVLCNFPRVLEKGLEPGDVARWKGKCLLVRINLNERTAIYFSPGISEI